MGLFLSKRIIEITDSVDITSESENYIMTPNITSAMFRSLEIKILRKNNILRLRYPIDVTLEYTIGTKELFIHITEPEHPSEIMTSRDFPWSNAFRKIHLNFRDLYTASEVLHHI